MNSQKCKNINCNLLTKATNEYCCSNCLLLTDLHDYDCCRGNHILPHENKECCVCLSPTKNDHSCCSIRCHMIRAEFGGVCLTCRKKQCMDRYNYCSRECVNTSRFLAPWKCFMCENAVTDPKQKYCSKKCFDDDFTKICLNCFCNKVIETNQCCSDACAFAWTRKCGALPQPVPLVTRSCDCCRGSTIWPFNLCLKCDPNSRAYEGNRKCKCPTCDNDILPGSRFNHCSPKCNPDSYLYKDHPCPNCNNNARAGYQYCSQKCDPKSRKYNGRNVKSQKCPTCNNDIPGDHPFPHCSPKCNPDSYLYKVHLCPTCGKKVNPSYQHCSRQCAQHRKH